MENRRKTLVILAAAIIIVALGVTIALNVTVKVPSETPPDISSSPSTILPGAGSYIGNSSIYLVSAGFSYGPYPYTSAEGPQPDATPVIKEGDTCLIINATIRNDYTLENPPPNQVTIDYANGTAMPKTAHVYVFFTAELYDKQGNIIQAVDVTPPYGFAYGGAYQSLGSGESGPIQIYMTTSRENIDHIEIVIRYIGTIPPP